MLDVVGVEMASADDHSGGKLEGSVSEASHTDGNTIPNLGDCVLVILGEVAGLSVFASVGSSMSRAEGVALEVLRYFSESAAACSSFSAPKSSQSTKLQAHAAARHTFMSQRVARTIPVSQRLLSDGFCLCTTPLLAELRASPENLFNKRGVVVTPLLPSILSAREYTQSLCCGKRQRVVQDCHATPVKSKRNKLASVGAC